MQKVIIALGLFCVMAAVADVVPVVRHVSTFNRKDVYEPSGAYRSKYDTDEGTHVDEQGDVTSYIDAEGLLKLIIAKRGSFGYYGPDGVYYSLSWVADHNGFRATGAHLPTPPK